MLNREAPFARGLYLSEKTANPKGLLRCLSVFASSSRLIPRIFGFQKTDAAKIFEMNSLAEASVVGMTDWNAKRAHQERTAA